MGILKVLFILTLTQIIFGELIRFDFGGGLVVKTIDVSIGFLTLAWIIWHLVKGKKINDKYIFYPVLFFAGISFISLVLNRTLLVSQFIVSFLYLVRWLTLACIYFLVSEFDARFKNIVRNILIAIGSLVVFFGYAQYFLYQDLANLFYLGWDEHLYRMFSTFLDPNFLGAFFVLYFLLILERFFYFQRKKRQWLVSILYLILLTLTLISIFLTFSRSAVIALITGTTVFLILENRKKFIIALFTILVFVFIISSKYFYIENINPFRVVSTQARIETTSNALSIIRDHPILGIGFNAYRYVQIQYGFRKADGGLKSHADAGVDNSLLFVLATSGIVGFSIYVLLLYRILSRYKKNSLVVASLSGIIINSMFVNSLFYPLLLLWIWTLLAITDYKLRS